jgi:hypothetical protein
MGGSYGLVGLIGMSGTNLKRVGKRERPRSLFDDRSEDQLAVSLYLEGGSTGPTFN